MSTMSRPRSAAEQRRHEVERKVAVNHGRDAGQHFEDGLENLARAGRGVLAQVDRDAQAHRQRDQHTDQAGQQRGQEERENAELADLGLPGRRGEELDQADVRVAEKRSASSSSTRTMPSVVRIDMAAQKNRKPWMSVSPMRLRGRRSSRAPAAAAVDPYGFVISPCNCHFLLPLAGTAGRSGLSLKAHSSHAAIAAHCDVTSSLPAMPQPTPARASAGAGK